MTSARMDFANPIAVIPNGVHLPTITPSFQAREQALLFLGRLHPKKGLTEMIEGWHRVPAEERGNWRLKSLAGMMGGISPAREARGNLAA